MKNIKNKDIDKICQSSRQERIHNKYAGTKWDDDYFTSGKTAYHWIERFIRKHVGKSYNKTYSEFVSSIKKGTKGLPYYLDGEPLRKLFKDNFEKDWGRFDVVDGIIHELPRRWYNNKPSKYYYEYPEGHKYRYTLKKEYKDNTSFRSIVIKCFGHRFYENLLCLLTEEEMKKILKTLENYYQFTSEFHKLKKYDYGYGYNWKNLFTCIDLAPKIQKEYTESMRKRDNAEADDQTKKRIRENKKLREERFSVLLHQIMESQKRLEEKINDIDIERHGFDKDESFRGEFYHGQKRKKK